MSTANGKIAPNVGLQGGVEPSNVGTKEVLVGRALARLRSIPGDLEKYTFLASLKSRNENVFYALVGSHMKELCPLIYTPVIGLACQNFSLIHPPPDTNTKPARALYLSAPDLPHLPEILANLKTRLPHDQMEIAVVTDGSRVLGLGDLGVGGMGISMGKLSLYVAAGGVNPKATLPIVVDFGTDNEKLLGDPLYVGMRQRRMSDVDCEAWFEVFMKEMHKTFPNMIIQFEDFHTTLAFPLLEKHRERYPCFNDDIQGTGSVILAGAIRAFAQNGIPLKEQRILFFGAGSSGVGVAETISKHFELAGSMTEDEARNRFWLVDSKGLVANNRGDKLPTHKQYLARREDDAPKLKTLLEVVKHVRPTALMGLSTLGGAFTREILEFMAHINAKPIVFALSNPVALAECTYEEAVEATNGTVLYASGSPFDPVQFEGKTYEPGQGNNMYIFPAVGLGAILAQVKTIPETIIHAAARALADSLNADEKERRLLYPDVERIREVTIFVALRVIRAAQQAGVDRNEKLRSMSDIELNNYIRGSMYQAMLEL
ncbi:BQ2448_7267 [Microbotryum intermedium]|uniref:Malic enzyme n=1 Tax=Microbotryum intermedium TaxID=269621 RepID=A0A238FMG2_9BASI|nr:BQ2448_7267 [Microbotryum intermedium]